MDHPRADGVVDDHERTSAREDRPGIAIGFARIIDRQQRRVRDPRVVAEHRQRRSTESAREIQLAFETFHETGGYLGDLTTTDRCTIGNHHIPDPIRREQFTGAQRGARRNGIENGGHRGIAIGDRRRPALGELQWPVIDDRKADTGSIRRRCDRDRLGSTHDQHAIVAIDRIGGQLHREQIGERGPRRIPSAVADREDRRHHPHDDRQIGHDRHRLTPPEPAPHHIGAEPTRHRSTAESEPESDRRHQGAERRRIERQSATIGHHGQHPEDDDQTGAADRPGQPPGPRHRESDERRQIQRERQGRETAPIDRQPEDRHETFAVDTRPGDHRRPRPRQRPRQIQDRGRDRAAHRAEPEPGGGLGGTTGHQGHRHEDEADHQPQHDHHRGERRRRRQQEREPRQNAPSITRRHLGDGIDQVTLGERRIGGPDPGQSAQEIHRPGQHRVPHQRGETPRRHDPGDERRADVDDHRRDARLHHREHRRQTPRTRRTGEHQSDHRDRHRERHAEQRHHAVERQPEPSRRCGGGDPGGTRIPTRQIEPREIERALRKRQELAHLRDTVVDERTRSDQHQHDDHDPGHERPRRGGPPSAYRRVDTEIGGRLTTARVHREPRRPGDQMSVVLLGRERRRRLHDPASGPQPTGARHQADDGAQIRPRLTEPTGEGGHDQLGDTHHHHRHRPSHDARR